MFIDGRILKDIQERLESISILTDNCETQINKQNWTELYDVLKLIEMDVKKSIKLTESFLPDEYFEP